jgi:hypothetical protein
MQHAACLHLVQTSAGHHEIGMKHSIFTIIKNTKGIKMEFSTSYLNKYYVAKHTFGRRGQPQ